jgi:hypothetical protein
MYSWLPLLSDASAGDLVLAVVPAAVPAAAVVVLVVVAADVLRHFLRSSSSNHGDTL